MFTAYVVRKGSPAAEHLEHVGFILPGAVLEVSDEVFGSFKRDVYLLPVEPPEDLEINLEDDN